MARLFLLFFFIVIFYSCNDQGEEYINHDKWKTIDDFAGRLKGNPKEVKETLFVNLSDTLFLTTLSGEPMEYLTHQFDEDGNLVFTKHIVDTLINYETHCKYDKNGMQYEFISPFGGNDTSRIKIISRRVGSGKYEAEKYTDDKIQYTDIISFINKGEKIVTERIFQGSNASTSTKFYKNGMLIKAIQKSRGLQKEMESNYYYSSNEFLDSSVVKIGGQVARRSII